MIIEQEPSIRQAEDAAMVFSGPQFFAALIAGVVMAFAFQLLLTNFGVALGISMAGGGLPLHLLRPIRPLTVTTATWVIRSKKSVRL
ncbi:MAG: hypothetical protein ACLFV6_05180 [Spirulinaceae cyanobacterium]